MFWFTNLIQKTSINNSLYVNQKTTQTPESSTLSLHKHMQVFPLCQRVSSPIRYFQISLVLTPSVFMLFPCSYLSQRGKLFPGFLFTSFFSRKSPSGSWLWCCIMISINCASPPRNVFRHIILSDTATTEEC